MMLKLYIVYSSNSSDDFLKSLKETQMKILKSKS